MARPIEPTPVLEGEDARALLDAMVDVASPETIELRQAWAAEQMARMMAPKMVVACDACGADATHWSADGAQSFAWCADHLSRGNGSPYRGTIGKV